MQVGWRVFCPTWLGAMLRRRQPCWTIMLDASNCLHLTQLAPPHHNIRCTLALPASNCRTALTSCIMIVAANVVGIVKHQMSWVNWLSHLVFSGCFQAASFV